MLNAYLNNTYLLIKLIFNLQCLLNVLIEKTFFRRIFQLQVVRKCPNKTDDMQRNHQNDDNFIKISDDAIQTFHKDS